MSDQESLRIKQLLLSFTVLFWLKASFTIAWGIAPGTALGEIVFGGEILFAETWLSTMMDD